MLFCVRKVKTLIIDADLYNGGVAASLDVDTMRDLYIATDDLANNRFDFLENYVKPYNENIDIMASPKDPRYASKVQEKYLHILLTKARMKYDVIIIDLTHIMDKNNLVILDFGKSFTRSIQSIGRVLRLAKDKTSANVFDISSILKYSRKHFNERIKYYEDEQHPYNIYKIDNWKNNT